MFPYVRLYARVTIASFEFLTIVLATLNQITLVPLRIAS